MRDYSFGNFISAQRKRCGLSQYQLGALVGVSDKAVSKWENGVSKPRTGMMVKLSEVLDISVDELLICEYVISSKRKDLFAMKRDILYMAKEKLNEVYGEHPPILISNRFAQEQLMLSEREILLWIGFFNKLHEEFKLKHAYFDIRGVQTGASFIAWLLKGTNINPLPAHYYCPKCKRVEFVFKAKCGLDLVDKKCGCGLDYQKDGFNIDAIHMYPLAKWTEIYVSKDATGFVENCLKTYFSDCGDIRKIQVCSKDQPQSPTELLVTRYGLISKEISTQYPNEVILLQPEEYTKFIKEMPGITVVENKNEKLCMDDIENTEFSKQQVKNFFDYAVKRGAYHSDEMNRYLDKIMQNVEEPKFSDLLILSGFMYGNGVWEQNAEELYNAGIPLEKLIFCREDVYEYLYDKLNNKCCVNPSGQVFEMKEAVSKGNYLRNGMPRETEKLLLECDVPEWYVNSMKKILYLFPKTQLVAGLKRDICKFVHQKQF